MIPVPTLGPPPAPSVFELPLRAGLVGSDGRIASFSRASRAWFEGADGLVREVAAGIARQRPDLGMLLEGARTNRLVWSRDLTQSSWTKTDATVARVADPTALGGFVSRITATATNGRVWQGFSGLPSAARAGRVRVRRASGKGAVVVAHGAGSVSVTPTAAWTWVDVIRTAAVAFSLEVWVTTAGDAVDVDWCQVEDGPAASSPIWSEATAVTRAADVLTVATDGWPVDHGWMEIGYANEEPLANVEYELLGTWTSYSSGTGYDGIVLEVFGGTGQIAMRVLDGAGKVVIVTGNSDGPWTPRSTVRIRGEWGQGTARIYRAGALDKTQGPGIAMPARSTGVARIGSRFDGSCPANGWISDLALGV